MPRVHLTVRGPHGAPWPGCRARAPLRGAGQGGAGAAASSAPVPAHPQVKLLREGVNVQVAGAGLCEAVALGPDWVQVIVGGLGQVAILLPHTGHRGDEADVISLLHTCIIIIVSVIIMMIIIITIATWSLIISKRVTVIT